MTPQTTAQNLMLWASALALAILLSFLSALAQQLPGDMPINWRMVWLSVIQTILTTAPLVAAGLGLPRLGKEGIASLVSEVGAGQAKAVLEVEAVKQATGIAPTVSLSDDDIGRLADRVLAENEARTTVVHGGHP